MRIARNVTPRGLGSFVPAARHRLPAATAASKFFSTGANSLSQLGLRLVDTLRTHEWVAAKRAPNAPEKIIWQSSGSEGVLCFALPESAMEMNLLTRAPNDRGVINSYLNAVLAEVVNPQMQKFIRDSGGLPKGEQGDGLRLGPINYAALDALAVNDHGEGRMFWHLNEIYLGVHLCEAGGLNIQSIDLDEALLNFRFTHLPDEMFKIVSDCLLSHIPEAMRGGIRVDQTVKHVYGGKIAFTAFSAPADDVRMLVVPSILHPKIDDINVQFQVAASKVGIFAERHEIGFISTQTKKERTFVTVVSGIGPGVDFNPVSRQIMDWQHEFVAQLPG